MLQSRDLRESNFTMGFQTSREAYSPIPKSIRRRRKQTTNRRCPRDTIGVWRNMEITSDDVAPAKEDQADIALDSALEVLR